MTISTSTPYDIQQASGKRFAKDVKCRIEQAAMRCSKASRKRLAKDVKRQIEQGAIRCPTGKWETLCQGRQMTISTSTPFDVQQASGKRFVKDVK